MLSWTHISSDGCAYISRWQFIAETKTSNNLHRFVGLSTSRAKLFLKQIHFRNVSNLYRVIIVCKYGALKNFHSLTADPKWSAGAPDMIRQEAIKTRNIEGQRKHMHEGSMQSLSRSSFWNVMNRNAMHHSPIYITNVFVLQISLHLLMNVNIYVSLLSNIREIYLFECAINIQSQLRDQ